MEIIRDHSKNKENSLTINTKTISGLTIKPLQLNRAQRGSFRQPSSKLLRRQGSGTYRTIQANYTGFHSLRKFQSQESSQFSRQLARIKLNSPPQPFLQKHQITPHYRAKMVDWMIEVIQSFQFSATTFFLSVHLLDKYFGKVGRALELEELHECGVVCLFIAIKYQEIHPIKLKQLYEKVAHKKIPVQKIKEREAQILNACQFKLAHAPTLSEYLGLLTQQMGLHFIPSFAEFSRLLAKIILFNYKLVTTIAPLQLIYGVIALALRATDTWNKTSSFQAKINELGKKVGQQTKKIVKIGKQIISTISHTQLQDKKNLTKYSHYKLSQQISRLQKDFS